MSKSNNRVCVVYDAGSPDGGELALCARLPLLNFLLGGVQLGNENVDVLLIYDSSDGPVPTLAELAGDRISICCFDLAIKKTRYARGFWGVAHKSYLVYNWLRGTAYESVYFQDYQGLGFYSQKAKQQGIAFSSTTFYCLLTLQSSRALMSLEYLGASRLALAWAYMEQEAVESADVVLGLQSDFDWCDTNRIKLPQHRKARQVTHQPGDNVLIPAEKNLVILLDGASLTAIKTTLIALERWNPTQRGTTKVTLLGSPLKIHRCKKNFSKQLKKLNPFVAINSIDSVAELLAYGDQCSIYVVLDGRGIQAALVAVLVTSQQAVLDLGESPLVPANILGSFYDDRRLCAATRSGNEFLECSAVVEPNTNAVSAHARAAMPLVSVCVVHHERPLFLRRVLDSLCKQSYQHIEIIVVDDGSTDENNLAELAEIEAHYDRTNFQLVRQPNQWLGAARNTAAEKAKGEYLIFMDDDNIASPIMVERYVDSILNCDADIMTCVCGIFEETGCSDFADGSPNTKRDFLPLGGAGGLGMLANVFGDAACIVKKDVFQSLGGYWSHYGVPKEDHAFFRHALASGYRLDVVPERLFYYRTSSDSMMSSSVNNASFDFSVREMLAQTEYRKPMFSPSEFRIIELMLAESLKRIAEFSLRSAAQIDTGQKRRLQWRKAFSHLKRILRRAWA